MIKSMTGYGRAQQVLEGYEITVEMRSVNHRYFEFYTRLPRIYNYLEDKLKNLIYEEVSRGKIDVYVEILSVENSDTKVHINHELARSYLNELRTLGEELSLTHDITLSRMIAFNDIFKVEKVTADEELIWGLVKTVAQDALEQLLQMRIAEGKKTKEDILSHAALIEQYTQQVETLASQTAKEYQQRLYDRLLEVLEDHQIEEQRLLTEAAIYADRIAVDEETVRLRSHLSQMYSILEEDQPVGRKLDFLLQEVNREINTIGSKAQNVEVSRLVVEMKSEAEKIREQVQNIE